MLCSAFSEWGNQCSVFNWLNGWIAEWQLMDKFYHDEISAIIAKWKANAECHSFTIGREFIWCKMGINMHILFLFCDVFAFHKMISFNQCMSLLYNIVLHYFQLWFHYAITIEKDFLIFVSLYFIFHSSSHHIALFQWKKKIWKHSTILNHSSLCKHFRKINIFQQSQFHSNHIILYHSALSFFHFSFRFNL